MTAALAHFLPEFDLRGKSAVRSAQADLSAQPAGIDPMIVEEMCRQAAARAREEAVAEMAAQHEADLAALIAHHKAELAALKAEMSLVAAEAVPAAVAARADAIAEAIAGDVARVLAPIVEKGVAARMTQSLAAEIRAAAALEGAGEIRLSGPADLVEAIRGRLDGVGASIVVGDSAGPEIVVTIDGARWSTRLEAWSQALSEALR